VSEFRVEGMDHLHKQLQTLPAKIEANVLRGAVRAGQKVIADKAKSLVPVSSGALRKSIRVTSSRQAMKRGVVRADVVAGNKAAWYARLIEFGTASFYTGSGKSVRKPYTIRAKGSDGKDVGTGKKRRALRVGGSFVSQVTHPGIKPRPFMRPASDLLGGQALEAFADYVRKRLPKEIEKAST